MRAIILAAGAGTRLRHLTAARPKCLVPVGDRPLLDHQLAALRAAGVADIVVVVGFEAGQVRRHGGPGLTYVENPEWATTNSIASFHRARAHLAGDVLLFNCDILFHPEALGRLIEAPGSALAVDRAAPRLAGEMNAQIDAHGRVSGLGKHLDPGTAHAVSVQLARFDAAGAGQVRAELDRLVADNVRDAFPTSAYGPLIAAGGLHAVDAGDLPWAEIDTVEELEGAARRVAPRLPPAVSGPVAGGR